MTCLFLIFRFIYYYYYYDGCVSLLPTSLTYFALRGAVASHWWPRSAASAIGAPPPPDHFSCLFVQLPFFKKIFCVFVFLLRYRIGIH